MSHVDALVVAQVAKRYGVTAAADGLDLRVVPGEVVAVIGPSGCGKSTFLRLVAGLERPDAGRIEIAGEVVADAATFRHPEKRRVGLVFQDHALFPHLTVARNVGFGLRGLARAARRSRVAELLDRVHLSHRADRHPHQLSGGEQQRVALARALAPDPALVLLDEPFSSLDEHLRGRVRAEIMATLRASGATAIVVTHDQDEALSIADRVVVMRNGRIEQVGTPSEVFERPANRFVATFMGDADFLPVTRDGADLRCELGSIEGVAAEADAGDRDVVLRPHEVMLTANGDAEVLSLDYHGAFTLATVRLASGAQVRSWLTQHQVLPVGARVTAGLVPGSRPVLLDRAADLD
ncbi:ABC transporter ATP-binding protein [Nocardioides sp. Bht2]|uniref:ABC transporter ATP-binding protein n=1 Tax=Nocardioides sp. Bht2 TaxID=3392297 RepID=UPI0039B41111